MNTALEHSASFFTGIIFAAFLSVLSPKFAEAAELYPELPGARSILLPEPAKLRNAVAFWQKVFALWDRHQVALHDAEALGVVYEVFTLPGFAEESQTDAQHDYVEWRKRQLADELRLLETRVRYHLPLDSRQQQLLAAIQNGGENASVVSASARLRSQRGMRERFLDGVTISGRYDALMRKTFRDRGLPEDLAYLPHVESSFQSRAHSFAGAAGAWQFMPATGRLHLNMNAAVDERYDPILAARGASHYLSDAYDQLGDWGLAVTSYNHGVGGMLRAQELFGNDMGRIALYYRGPAFGFASRNFYAEFLAVRGILNKPAQFFPGGVRMEAPLDHERVSLPQPMRLGELATFLSLSQGTLISLNPALTNAAVAESCPIPALTDIWLPRGTLARTAPLDRYQPAVDYASRSEPRFIKVAWHRSRPTRRQHLHASSRRHSAKHAISARKAVFTRHKKVKTTGLRGKRLAQQ